MSLKWNILAPVYNRIELQYTANSIKVDIDNSQMGNMIDRVPIDMMILYMRM